MAVNLDKYKCQIVDAWKDVISDKSSTDWALFGYDGQTNDLMVVAKGDSGIEEMKEDLNSNKIMYAFCRILDPKTSRRKFVLINWQGEGAPLVRKGVCANHIHAVANILKGFHVTMNARTEEDVDEELIIDKVAKSTASVYSFEERIDLSKDGFQKMDPAYKKVEPSKEISAAERDRFWAEEEEEENKRQEELRRKQEEQRRLQKEQMEREIEEARKKEQAQMDKEPKPVHRMSIKEEISHLRKGETYRPEQLPDRAEEIRKMRYQETKELISKRTVNVRAIFEQNTSVGQLHLSRKMFEDTQLNGSLESATRKDEEKQIQHANKVEIYNGMPTNGYSTDDHQQQEAADTSQEVSSAECSQISSALEYTSNGIIDGDKIYLSEDLGLQAEALYDYQAADDTEISFDPGDVITHIEQIDPGWWQGLGPDGTYGLFPANYVQLLE